MIRFYANFEMGINATKRVIDYADVKTEPKDGDEPPASWPSAGVISVDNLTVSCAPELPPVPKKLLFTLKSNEHLNDALERMHPGSSNDTSTSFALNAPVSEGGGNFSQGQRQLLCLARSILQQRKVLVLDEANSSFEMETDGYIQQAIRSEFGGNMSSLLVIARRLSTIADFDCILAMGTMENLWNWEPPKELLAIKKGVFWELVNQSGEKAPLERTIRGEQQYSEVPIANMNDRRCR
ncbi:hypothetical protein AC578_8321 [Pseudocercospora eumusae]|uniref:ABC transporter domain-containing protein n=1 Tax=Pseudocercospora eumusae TaxID=321146 RepID=A0A139H320_9PEZI|nr:hypothetical protein AC578_8321 [Pseudocercospora eumusae]